MTLITMTLQLAPDEPEAGRWRAEPLTVAAATVVQPGRATPPVTALSSLPWTGAAPEARPLG